MARKKIAIDAGKYMTKVVMATSGNPADDVTWSFRTRIEEKTGFAADNATTVKYNGKEYIVGGKSSKSADGEHSSSKNTLTHKICILTAIAHMVSKVSNGSEIIEIDACIGCPLDIYGNKASRSEFLNNMLPIGETITINLNGKEISFTVGNARVLPESSGIIYLNGKKYRDAIVVVCDGGGLNYNTAMFQDLQIVPDQLFTSELGSYSLNSALADWLVNEKGMDRAKLADNVLEKAIKDGKLNRVEGSEQAIKEIKLKTCRALKDACDAQKIDITLTELVFTGGTSLLLKPEIKEVFGVDDSVFYEDAVFANARGFLNFIRRK